MTSFASDREPTEDDFAAAEAASPGQWAWEILTPRLEGDDWEIAFLVSEGIGTWAEVEAMGKRRRTKMREFLRWKHRK